MKPGWLALLGRWLLLALGVSLAAQGAQSATSQNADDLLAMHRQLAPQLAASAFGRPLLIESSATADDPHGDVYAVLDHAFGSVAGLLTSPGPWCDVLLLQSNVKRCVVRADLSPQSLSLAIGRKFDQPIESSFRLEFTYAVPVVTADRLTVQLAADEGPLGTRDYRVQLDAVALDARRTFVHLSYAYDSSLAARLATDAYLATVGRNKVGFTVIGSDSAGRKLHVGGVRGIAERNVMRYFLAIEALLHTQQVPADRRLEARLRSWFAATERHPRQLHEMTLADYLAMKRLEASTGQ